MENSEKSIPVLYQDENLIAVDKPAGMLVHAYKKETNEKDHLLRRVKEQTGHYLYPLHRLDRPVSGIVLFGLNPEIVRELQAVWHSETTIKEYIALAKGNINEAGVFSFPLFDENKRKQAAQTQFEPIKAFENVTLMRIRIDTGRKHQIRRHFSRRCANIVGDKKYGQGKLNSQFQKNYGLDRIFLHATRFKIETPETAQVIDVQSPLPTQLRNVLDAMKNG